MSDIMIDGKVIGKLISVEVNHETTPAEFTPMGEETVTGTITCYFHDPDLLEAFYRREMELQEFIRNLFESPLPPPLWKRLLRIAAWAATALVLLTLSTGAM